MADLPRQCPTYDLVFWITGPGDEDQMPRFLLCDKCANVERLELAAKRERERELEFHDPEVTLENLPAVPTAEDYWQD